MIHDHGAASLSPLYAGAEVIRNHLHPPRPTRQPRFPRHHPRPCPAVTYRVPHFHQHQTGYPLLLQRQLSSQAGTGTTMRLRRCVHRVGVMWESIEGLCVRSRKSRACTPALAIMMNPLIRMSSSLAQEASLLALCHLLRAVVLALLRSLHRVPAPVAYHHMDLIIRRTCCVVICRRRHRRRLRL